MSNFRICPRGHGPFENGGIACEHESCCEPLLLQSYDRAGAEAEIARILGTSAPARPVPRLEMPWGTEPVERSIGLGRDETHSPFAALIQSAERDPDRPVVSRQHAMIVVRDHGLAITDTGSKHGTFVNGNRIDPHVAVPLEGVAHIRLGPHFSFDVVTE